MKDVTRTFIKEHVEFRITLEERRKTYFEKNIIITNNTVLLRGHHLIVALSVRVSRSAFSNGSGSLATSRVSLAEQISAEESDEAYPTMTRLCAQYPYPSFLSLYYFCFV